MKMKKVKITNWLMTIILVSFFLYSQGPSLVQNVHNEGKVIKSFEAYSLNSASLETFPRNEKQIFIFWATWCGPCKLEMNRLKNSVEEGEIDGSKIIAYSAYEDIKTIQKFLRKNPYPFEFVIDKRASLAYELGLSLTPTVIHFNERKAEYIGTGVSPLLVFRAKDFLN